MTSISSRSALGLLSLALLTGGATAAHSQNYAASVAGSSSLSPNPLLSNPTAVLGQPTTLFEDPGTYDTAGEYHTSIVTPPYYTTPSGGNALAGLGSTGLGTLTIQLAAPITHSDSHWYGDDFIVYGNATFSGADATTGDYDITPTTNMSNYIIDGYGIYQNGTPTVSVSTDGINFIQLATTQIFYPDNYSQWAGITQQNPSGWGALNDFSKPVDPTLTQADFAGQSVAYADNTLFDGSAGGQAFSLAGSGLSTINYIEFTGFGNIDAVAGVSDNPAAVPEASSVVSFGLLMALGLGVLTVRRSRKVSQ
jgi:hypothetical protein